MEINQDVYDAEVDNLVRYEEQVKEQKDVLIKLEMELAEITTKASARTLETTKHNLDLMTEQYNIALETMRAGQEEMGALPSRQAAQYTKMAEQYGKETIERIKNYAESRKIELQAKFMVGGSRIEDVEQIVNSQFLPHFTAIEKATQDAFNRILEGLNLPPDELKMLKDRIGRLFTSIFTDGINERKEYLRNYINDISKAVIGDIGETKPLIELGFETIGIGQTKDQIQEMVKFSKELKELEKARIPTLQNEVALARTRAQEAQKELPIAKERLRLAEEYEMSVRKEIENYKTSNRGGVSGAAERVRLQEKLTGAIDDTRTANQGVVETYKKWKDNIVTINGKIQELRELALTTASDWEKAGYGMKASWIEFKTSATDAFEVVNQLSSTFLEGFSTAMSDTMTAIFQPPAQEITDAKTALDDLYQQKADIANKMKLIAVGGIGPEDVEEYNNLKKQLADVNEQLSIAKDNLDDLKSTAKRVGEAFRQFGITILDALQQIIAKLLIVSMFHMIGGILGSLFGTPTETLIAAKGAIFKGGFKPVIGFEKGGIAEGGFTSLDKTQKASWTPFLQNMMKAKFLQSGGVTRGPMLGVIGEGSRNEAVVPLPDNKSIPVSFTNDKKTQAPSQDVKIVNLIDPKMIPSIMLQYPEAILNVISEDVLKRGPIYQLLRKV
jgi:hypothetical protein